MERSCIFIILMLVIIMTSCSIQPKSTENFGLMKKSIKNIKTMSKCSYNIMKTGMGMIFDFWTFRWI